MAAIDYTDFYILDKNFTAFNDTDLIEDDLVKIIVQKYQMVIFTNNGDVLGDYNFGGNLEQLLYETKVSAETVKEYIGRQIMTYIPEAMTTSFSIDVDFQEDPENFQDIMFIYFSISEYEIINQIGGISI